MSRQFTVESAARTCSRSLDCRRYSSLYFPYVLGVYRAGRVLASRITHPGTRILGKASHWKLGITNGQELESWERNGYLDSWTLLTAADLCLSLVEGTLMQRGLAVLNHP